MIDRVEFYVDGKLHVTREPTATNASQFSYTWKPGAKVKPGKHKIRAVAINDQGLSAEARSWVVRR